MQIETERECDDWELFVGDGWNEEGFRIMFYKKKKKIKGWCNK